MLIQINTDSNIAGDTGLTRRVETLLADTVDRHRDQVTRISVHLRDDNSSRKSGTQDMRCQIEARLAGRQPLSVSHRAESLDRAINGAAEKLQRALDRTLGRLDRR